MKNIHLFAFPLLISRCYCKANFLKTTVPTSINRCLKPIVLASSARTHLSFSPLNALLSDHAIFTGYKKNKLKNFTFKCSLPLKITFDFFDKKRSFKQHCRRVSALRGTQSTASNPLAYVLNIMLAFSFKNIPWQARLDGAAPTLFPNYDSFQTIPKESFNFEIFQKNIINHLIRIYVDDYFSELNKNAVSGVEEEREFLSAWSTKRTEGSNLKSVSKLVSALAKGWMQRNIRPCYSSAELQKNVAVLDASIQQYLALLFSGPLLETMIVLRKIELLYPTGLTSSPPADKRLRDKILNDLSSTEFLNFFAQEKLDELPSQEDLKEFLEGGYFVNDFSASKDTLQENTLRIEQCLKRLLKFLSLKHDDSSKQQGSSRRKRSASEATNVEKKPRKYKAQEISHEGNGHISDTSRPRRDLYNENFLGSKAEADLDESARKFIEILRKKESMSPKDPQEMFTVLDKLPSDEFLFDALDRLGTEVRKIYPSKSEPHRKLYVYFNFFEENLEPYKQCMLDMALLTQQDIEALLKVCKLNKSHMVAGKKVYKYALLLYVSNLNIISLSDLTHSDHSDALLDQDRLADALKDLAEDCLFFITKKGLSFSRDLTEEDFFYNFEKNKIFISNPKAVKLQGRSLRSSDQAIVSDAAILKKFIKNFQSENLKDVKKDLSFYIPENSTVVEPQKGGYQLFAPQLLSILNSGVSHDANGEEILIQTVKQETPPKSFSVKVIGQGNLNQFIKNNQFKLYRNESTFYSRKEGEDFHAYQSQIKKDGCEDRDELRIYDAKFTLSDARLENFLRSVYLDAFLYSALGNEVTLFITPNLKKEKEIQNYSFALVIKNIFSNDHIALDKMTTPQIKKSLREMSHAFENLMDDISKLAHVYGLNLSRDLKAQDLEWDAKKKRFNLYSGAVFCFEELQDIHPKTRVSKLKTEFLNKKLNEDPILNDFLKDFPAAFLPERLISLLFVPLASQFPQKIHERGRKFLIKETAQLVLASLSDAEKKLYFEEINGTYFECPQFTYEVDTISGSLNLMSERKFYRSALKLKNEENQQSIKRVFMGRSGLPCILGPADAVGVGKKTVEIPVFYDSTEKIWKEVFDVDTYKKLKEFALPKSKISTVKLRSPTARIEFCDGLPFYVEKNNLGESIARSYLDFTKKIRLGQNASGKWILAPWLEYSISENNLRELLKYGITAANDVSADDLEFFDKYRIYNHLYQRKQYIKIYGKFYEIDSFNVLADEKKISLTFTSQRKHPFNLIKISDHDPMWHFSIDLTSVLSKQQKKPAANEIDLLRKPPCLSFENLKAFLGIEGSSERANAIDWGKQVTNILDLTNKLIASKLEIKRQRLVDESTFGAMPGKLPFHNTAVKEIFRTGDFMELGEIFSPQSKNLGIPLRVFNRQPQHLELKPSRCRRSKKVYKLSDSAELHCYGGFANNQLKLQTLLLDACLFANEGCSVRLAIVPRLPEYSIFVHEGVKQLDFLLYVENLKGYLLSELQENFPEELLDSIKFYKFLDQLEKLPVELANSLSAWGINIDNELEPFELFLNTRSKKIHCYSSFKLSRPETAANFENNLQKIKNTMEKFKAGGIEGVELSRQNWEKIYLNQHIEMIEREAADQYPEINIVNLRRYLNEQLERQNMGARPLDFENSKLLKSAASTMLSLLSRADREAYLEKEEPTSLLTAFPHLFFYRNGTNLSISVEDENESGEIIVRPGFLSTNERGQLPEVLLPQPGRTPTVRKYIYYNQKRKTWVSVPQTPSFEKTFKQLQQMAFPSDSTEPSLEFIYGFPIKLAKISQGKYWVLSPFDSSKIGIEYFGNNRWQLTDAENISSASNEVKAELVQGGIQEEGVDPHSLSAPDKLGIFKSEDDTQYIKIEGKFYRISEFKPSAEGSIHKEGFLAKVKFYSNEKDEYLIHTILGKTRLFLNKPSDDQELFEKFKALAELDEKARQEKLACLKDYLLDPKERTFLASLRYIGRVMASPIETISKSIHRKNFFIEYGECPPEKLSDDIALGVADFLLSIFIGLIAPASTAGTFSTKLIAGLATNLPALVGDVIESICGHIENEDMALHDILTVLGLGIDAIGAGSYGKILKKLPLPGKSSLFAAAKNTFSSVEKRILSSTFPKKLISYAVQRPEFEFLHGKTFIKVKSSPSSTDFQRFELNSDLTIEEKVGDPKRVYWHKLDRSWRCLENKVIADENLMIARKYGVIPQKTQEAQTYLGGQSKQISILTPENQTESVEVIDFYGELVPFIKSKHGQKGKIFDFEHPNEVSQEVEFRDGRWTLSKFNILPESGQLDFSEFIAPIKKDLDFRPTESLPGVYTDKASGEQYIRSLQGYAKIYLCSRDPKIFTFAENSNKIFKLELDEQGFSNIKIMKNVAVEPEVENILSKIPSLNVPLNKPVTDDMLENFIFSEKKGGEVKKYILWGKKAYEIFPFNGGKLFSLEKNKGEIFTFTKKPPQTLLLSRYADLSIVADGDVLTRLKNNHIHAVEANHQKLLPIEGSHFFKSENKDAFYINLNEEYYEVVLRDAGDPKSSSFWFKKPSGSDQIEFFINAQPGEKPYLKFEARVQVTFSLQKDPAIKVSFNESDLTLLQENIPSHLNILRPGANAQKYEFLLNPKGSAATDSKNALRKTRNGEVYEFDDKTEIKKYRASTVEGHLSHVQEAIEEVENFNKFYKTTTAQLAFRWNSQENSLEVCAIFPKARGERLSDIFSTCLTEEWSFKKAEHALFDYESIKVNAQKLIDDFHQRCRESDLILTPSFSLDDVVFDFSNGKSEFNISNFEGIKSQKSSPLPKNNIVFWSDYHAKVKEIGESTRYKEFREEWGIQADNSVVLVLESCSLDRGKRVPGSSIPKLLNCAGKMGRREMRVEKTTSEEEPFKPLFDSLEKEKEWMLDRVSEEERKLQENGKSGFYGCVRELTPAEKLALPGEQSELFLIKEYKEWDRIKAEIHKLYATEKETVQAASKAGTSSKGAQAKFLSLNKMLEMAENGAKMMNYLYGQGSAFLRLTSFKHNNAIFQVQLRMKKIAGKSLDDWIIALKDGKLSSSEIIRMQNVMEDLENEVDRWAELLIEKNFRHGDLHIANIMLDLESGQLNLIDFDKSEISLVDGLLRQQHDILRAKVLEFKREVRPYLYLATAEKPIEFKSLGYQQKKALKALGVQFQDTPKKELFLRDEQGLSRLKAYSPGRRFIYVDGSRLEIREIFPDGRVIFASQNLPGAQWKILINNNEAKLIRHSN